MEWRTLALIAHLQPVRLRDLAAYTGADKAQISRIASALVRRGLAVREAPSPGGHPMRLKLSELGQDRMDVVTRALQEQDRALRACLKPSEIEHFIATLARVRARALQLADDDEARQPARSRAPARPI